MRKLFILAVLAAMVSTLAAQNNIQVYFAYGSAIITDSAKAELDEWLLTVPIGSRVYVTGHTDADGDEAYNRDLSLRRASNVAQYLLSHAPEKKLHVESSARGEVNPIASNATSAGKQSNRRVELTLSPAESDGLDDGIHLRPGNPKKMPPKDLSLYRDPIPEAQIDRKMPQTSSREVWQNIVDQYTPRPSYHYGNIKSELSIETRGGTVLTIPANALSTADGEPFRGEYVVAITEYNTYTAMMLGEMHTMSDGKPLESGGMVHIQVTTKTGEPLKLLPGAQAQLLFNANPNFVREDMRLFTDHSTSNVAIVQGTTLPATLDQRIVPSNLDQRTVPANSEIQTRVNWALAPEPSTIGVTYVEKTVGMTLAIEKAEGFGKNPQVGDQVLDGKKIAMMPVYDIGLSDFGYINCDRFLKSKPLTTVQLACSSDRADQCVAYLAFNDVRCFMLGWYNAKTETFVFPNIPADRPVTAILVETTEAEVLLGKQKVRATNEPIVVEMHPVTPEFPDQLNAGTL